MEEAGIDCDQPFIADDKAPKVPQPRECPFDDPPSPIPPQLAPILMGRALVVAPSRDDWLNAPPGQPSAQGITVIAPIGNQARRPFAWASRLSRASHRDGAERLLNEAHLPRAHPPSTATHPLGPFAPFLVPALGPPFLRGRSSHPQSIHPNAASVGR